MHIHNIFGDIKEDSWHAGNNDWTSEHDQWTKESAEVVPALTGVDEEDSGNELAGVGVAYELGRRAHKAGKTISDNPYSATEEARKYDEWEKGLSRGKWDAKEANMLRNKVSEESASKPVDMKRWMRDFDRREDKNFHTENAVAIAKLVGTPEDVKLANAIKKDHLARGSLSHEMYEKRTALVNKLWPLVKQKIADGQQGVAEGTDQGSGEPKAFTDAKLVADKATQLGYHGRVAHSTVTGYSVIIARDYFEYPQWEELADWIDENGLSHVRISSGSFGASTRIVYDARMDEGVAEGADYGNLENEYYYVVDTQTGEVVDGPFDSVGEVPLRLMGFDGGHKVAKGAELKGLTEETGDEKFDNMMSNVKQPGAIEQTIKQLEAQKDQAEAQLAKVREATKAIKYEDTVSAIISQVTAIAASDKNFDQREIKWWESDLSELQNQLASKVYGIEDAFKDVVRNLEYKIEELQNDLDYPDELNESAEELNIGDPVIITGKGIQYEGTTGDIVDFGKDKRFVVVDLYNHGKHSFHSSDVSYNDYADSDDEDMRMYDTDPQYRDHVATHGDELDEVSSKLAGDYYGAATKQHVAKVGMKPNMYDRIEQDMGKQRKQGVDRAFDRIMRDTGKPVKEGDVIHHKFAIKQAQKGKTPYFKNPDIEVPMYDRKLGKAWHDAYSHENPQEPFASFEVQPAGKNANHIVGITKDGKKIRISTSTGQLADVLVNAYNRGGFSDVPLRKVPMGSMDEGSVTDPKDIVKRAKAVFDQRMRSANGPAERMEAKEDFEHILKWYEEQKNGVAESYYTGYNAPFRGVGGARGREDDEGWENEKNNNYWSQPRNNKPQLVGMYFYNILPADEQDALAIGLKKTKSGKWALMKYNTSGSNFVRTRMSADRAFGQGRYWEPKKMEETSNDPMAVDSTSPVGGKVDESPELRDNIYERLKGWILTKDPEFITRNGGPRAVMDAMEEVADWHSDAEEFGSSDFTACLQSLFRHFGETFDRTKYYTNEGYYKKLKEERDAKTYKKAYSMLGELKNILDK
jgi:hypothetical protein